MDESKEGSRSPQKERESQQAPLFSPTSTPNVSCAICHLNASRYKCPACAVTTCSCHCVKQHKLKTGCNGKRNRAKFIEKSKFTSDSLRSDFHFLEDTKQLRSSAKRTAGDCFGNKGLNKVPKKEPEPCETMEDIITQQQQFIKLASHQHTQSAAKLQKGANDHGVELALMPSGMSKRKQNSSRYFKKEDKIYWKVHLNFILEEGVETPHLINYDSIGLNAVGNIVGVSSLPKCEVCEDSTIQDMVFNFLETNSANLSNRHHLRRLRSQKQMLECFMQHIPSPAMNPIFVKLSMNSTLRSSLSGKKIIEYPTFVVGVPSQTSHLKLLVKEINALASENDVLSPGKRKCFNDLAASTKKVRLDEEQSSHSDSKHHKDEEVKDGFENDGSFLEQLVDLEGADVLTLQNLIKNYENED